jgi:hypothetical protein
MTVITTMLIFGLGISPSKDKYKYTVEYPTN